jgi:hypothetical protein
MAPAIALAVRCMADGVRCRPEIISGAQETARALAEMIPCHNLSTFAYDLQRSGE